MKNITKQDILQAYIDLHMKLPHNKISMKILSDKSGYSRRTIYLHFDSKEELMSEALAHELKDYELIDFSKKNVSENAKLFYMDIDMYKDILVDIFSISKLLTKFSDSVEGVLIKQELINSKIISASLASGIVNAMYEYCKEETYTLDELGIAITTLISPYIKTDE